MVAAFELCLRERRQLRFAMLNDNLAVNLAET